MKSVADRVQKKLLIRDLVNGFDFFARQSQGQYAVVGPDKKVIHRLDREGSSCAANARVNHGDVDSPLGKKLVTGRQSKRAGTDVACRNFMRDIDNLRARLKAKDDALHRSDKPIGRAEVGR